MRFLFFFFLPLSIIQLCAANYWHGDCILHFENKSIKYFCIAKVLDKPFAAGGTNQ